MFLSAFLLYFRPEFSDIFFFKYFSKVFDDILSWSKQDGSVFLPISGLDDVGMLELNRPDWCELTDVSDICNNHDKQTNNTCPGTPKYYTTMHQSDNCSTSTTSYIDKLMQKLQFQLKHPPCGQIWACVFIVLNLSNFNLRSVCNGVVWTWSLSLQNWSCFLLLLLLLPPGRYLAQTRSRNWLLNNW